MSEYVKVRMPPADPALSGRAAIVGIGETDYHDDYQAERRRAEGWQAPIVEDLAATAFERALADSGLTRADIDGVSCSFTYGGPPPDEMARMLGLTPRLAISNGNIMAGPLPAVCAEIAAGRADCVAMIYAVANRTAGRSFGGNTYAGDQGGTPKSYYYYHPWGWSSQAAHWAMMFTHYCNAYGTTEADLAKVAIQVRENARRYPQAVMQAPMDIESYLAARMIVRPLRLFDLCVVNDGAVCLIVRRADMANDGAKVPVLVTGWAETAVKQRKMEALVRDRLHGIISQAGGEALAMAGTSLEEIGHFEGYDAASIHLINQVEGLGFCAPGEGLAFCADGQMGPGGRIPTNTAGGNLSGSYMHGWSQVVEAVRQLRHEAGARQVPGLMRAMTALTQTDQCHPIVYARGE